MGRVTAEDEVQEPFRMAIANVHELLSGLELLPGVGPYRLQHRDARTDERVVRDHYEALLQKRRQRLEHVANRLTAADRLQRVERRTAGEHGDTGEERLLPHIEQPVTPVEGCTQRALPIR